MSDPNRGGGGLYPHAVTQEEMLDRIALQHLVATYGHAIDRRDYGLLRSLYHEDAVDDHNPYYCGLASGFIDWLPTILATWSATSHSMFNMLFLLNGAQAEGVVTTRAWHRTADGKRAFIAWGRYADRYEKREGIWRFAHRFFILDASEERELTSADNFDTEGVEIGKAGSDDPLYRRLQMFLANRQFTNGA